MIGRVAVGLLAGTVALYFLVRGVAEFWVVDPTNPATYAQDWGGPSLLGVFAVHTGPAVAVVVLGALVVRRRTTSRAPR